jgi:hypothetical protein
MRTITIELYPFDELNMATQKKVLEKYHDINTDHDWWNNVYYMYTETLKKQGFTCNKDFTFSLYTQGHNARIESASLDLIEWIKCDPKNRDRFSTLNEWINGFNISSGRVDHDHIGDAPETVDDLYDELHEIIQAEVNEIQEHMLRDLYSDCDYLSSDEAIKDTFEANEYTFESDGTMRNA